jgi:hypothetical protein
LTEPYREKLLIWIFTKTAMGTFQKTGFSLRGKVEENISLKTFFVTVGEEEGG